MMKHLLLLFFLITPAMAKDFPVSDQDQAAIQSICDLAALSTAINRDLRANIAAWCVAWEKRMQDANKSEPESKK